jgi:hypothetical protein
VVREGVRKKGRRTRQRPLGLRLILLFADFFPGTLSGQGLLHPALLARLQIVGVTLHFLNDVFGLNLALETAQGVLQGLALLQSNFCHAYHP